jgi:hypothetical protein
MGKINTFFIIILITFISFFNIANASEPGYLGVSIRDFTQTIDNESLTGVQLLNIFDDGAVKNSKLLENDIITKINGITVANSKTITTTLEQLYWGDEVELTYWRNGFYYNEKIILGAKKVVRTYNVSKIIKSEEEVWFFKDDNTEIKLNEEGNPTSISKLEGGQLIETLELTEGNTNEQLPQVFFDLNDKMQAINIIKRRQDEKGTSSINEVIFIKTVTTPLATTNPINNSQELEAEKFLVSPNPSIDGIFNLNFILKEKMPAKILIFDISGKQVYFNDLEDFDGTFNEKIDLGKNLAKGTYLIQVQQNGKKRNEKLILQ